MELEAKRVFPLETGGVLLGYSSDSTDEVVVRTVVGPGPLARHDASGFLPDQRYHEAEVARLYAESGRTWTYLGDWHTHPNSTAGLSLTDRRTLGRVSRANAARVTFPIMAILAGSPCVFGDEAVRTDAVAARSGWQLAVWKVRMRPNLWAAQSGRIATALCMIHFLE